MFKRKEFGGYEDNCCRHCRFYLERGGDVAEEERRAHECEQFPNENMGREAGWGLSTTSKRKKEKRKVRENELLCTLMTDG